MAVAIPFNVIADLVTKLGVGAFREICSVYGLDDDLKKLQETLSTINVVLLDADRRQTNNNQIQLWIQRLNDVVYDADDLLDAFHTKNLQREDGKTKMQEVREFFSSSNQLAFRYKLGRKIKKIRERLDEIAANMSMFNFVVIERVIDRARVDGGERETDSYVLESEVIGRMKEKKEIIDMLKCLTTEENVSIISIFGIGGLGKTTLTQLVYCDKRVVKHFESMIWVCVSEDFEKKSLVRRILKSITNKEVGDLEMDQLQRQLRENIGGKRYLLVLDDVWNEDYEKWAGVKKFLVGGGRGSKILVTTRSRTVSSVMGVEKPYILKGLTRKQSWNLFENIAFLGRKEVHPNIKAIGEQIIGRCKGVPLAIRSLGSVMKSKAKESEWLAIQNSEVWSLCESENSIMPILKLSYDHLPIRLRQCFAFCSIFPKDHVFVKDLLIQLWMAQDYIQSSHGSQFLEDVGNQYFEDLLSRSFFQEVKVKRVGYYNEIDTCKMHDLIHDLAIRVAGTHCRFIAQNDVAVNISERLNHVSFEHFSQDVPRELLQAKGLRTYFSISSLNLAYWNHFSSEEYRANIFLLSKFKRMRVLDLRRCDFKMLPNWLCKMQHLRYLDLSYNDKMEVILNSITNLVNLQMLNLYSCRELKELPEGIGKLISLRHLVIDRCFKISHMPRGLEKLISLRTLSRFIVGGDERKSIGIGALKGLNNLGGSLSIEKLEKVRDARLESKAANLMGKRHLGHLILTWCWKLRDIDDDDDAEILLEGLQPHPNLKKLGIEGYRGARFPSWMMGNMEISLPNIVSISLNNCPNIKQLPPFYRLPSPPSFPCLTELRISKCPMLTSMPLHPLLETLHVNSVSEKLLCQLLTTTTTTTTTIPSSSSSSSPSLSRLRDLTIRNIEALPEEDVLRNLTSLKTLYIQCCPRLLRLAAIQHLTALKHLNIYDCEELSDDGMNWQSLSSFHSLLIQHVTTLPEWLQHVTTLQHIIITGCPGLVALPEWMSNLTSLILLQINGCPLLNERCQKDTGEDWPNIAHIPRIQIDWKFVQERACWLYTIPCMSAMKMLLVVMRSAVLLLAGRRFYENVASEDLEALPEDVLRNLTSLKTLSIYSCPRLLRLALSREIQHLTALEYLRIHNCEEFDLSDDGMNWQGLRSLHKLRIEKFLKLVSLPEGIQHITTLQHLEISNCPGLVALLEWISNLNSLKTLYIRDSPSLMERCREDTGEDWPKIARIPNINIVWKSLAEEDE